MIGRVCRENKWRAPVYFTDPSAARKARAVVERLDSEIGISLREIEASDFVIILGTDPLNEAPMLAMAVRQACRKGATTVVVDPRPVSLPFSFTHFPLVPGDIEPFVGCLTRSAFAKGQKRLRDAAKVFFQSLASKFGDKEMQPAIQAIAEKLRHSTKPVIVCGTDIVRESTPAFAADLARFLVRIGKNAGAFFVLPGASSYSGALLSGEDGDSLEEVLEGIEKGSVKALIAVESDPFHDYPDRERLEKALGKLPLLIAMDYLPTETVKHASIFHPSSTVFETASTFVNQEGRAQHANRVQAGGLPVWGAPPPRRYGGLVPGGDHRPAWEILWQIAGGSEYPGAESPPLTPGDWIPAEHPAFKEIDVSHYPVNGLKLVPDKRAGEIAPATAGTKKRAKTGELELLLVDRMFCTRELAIHSDSLQGAIFDASILMHSKDAGMAGLADGEAVSLELDGGSVVGRLSVSDRMAEGIVIVPRHPSIEWRKLKGFSVRIAPGQITKVAG